MSMPNTIKNLARVMMTAKFSYRPFSKLKSKNSWNPNAQDWMTTANKMGWSQPPSTPADYAFLSAIINNANARVLYVAAGQGCMIFRIFAFSDTPPIVHTVELHQKHLDDITQTLAENMPEDKCRNFIPQQGNIHETEFPPQFFEYICERNLLHFSTGAQIGALYKKYFTWLTPRGKLFSSGNSPFTKLNKETGILASIEENEKQGKPFPGEINNFGELVTLHNPEVGKRLPALMNFLTPPILKPVAKKAGFTEFHGGFSPLPFFKNPNNPSAEAAAALVRLDPQDQDHGKEFYWTTQTKPPQLR